MSHVAWLDEYKALHQSAGAVDLAERTQIELRGADRVAFLHNFCTNDIRKLAAGDGCEAFITTAQGKTLAYVYVFTGPDSIVIETVPGQGERLRHHFEHYLIREKVEIIDRSNDWAEWLLAGPEAEAVVRRVLRKGEIPTKRFSSREVTFSETHLWLRRFDVLGTDGFLIDCLRSDHAQVGKWLRDAGAKRVSHEVIDAARLEAGVPLFGHDITEHNLPQEVGRDEQTISFTKGCYLGQETVARIDALGHVNRKLVSLRFLEERIPKPGLELVIDDTIVGQVTSACWSPKLEAPIALSYVRRTHCEPGSRVASAMGPADVIVVPI